MDDIIPRRTVKRCDHQGLCSLQRSHGFAGGAVRASRIPRVKVHQVKTRSNAHGRALTGKCDVFGCHTASDKPLVQSGRGVLGTAMMTDVCHDFGMRPNGIICQRWHSVYRPLATPVLP